MLDTVKKLVLATSDVLKNQNLTLATAESCTGGGLSYWLTSVPGSSQWFDRGFITYSNLAKMEMIDVAYKTLEQHGAVSGETAYEMAMGVLKKTNVALSIAITGIAGPDGGTADKPVGTIWIGIAKRHRYCHTFQQQMTGDRQQIRLQTIAFALENLLHLLKK